MTYEQLLEMIEIVTLNGDTLSNKRVSEMIGAKEVDVAMERSELENIT
jgi:hypothetical protein